MECEKKLLSYDGWNLKQQAIHNLQDELSGNKKQNIKEIASLALHCDLYDIGEKYIQEKISSSKDNLLVGPCVLQVGKVRNISTPKESEHSNIAPRMLRVILTDGYSSITAIEFEPIEQISLKTPPGTKVKLIGSIVISAGILQLHPGCVKVLGGQVEKLYTKWKIATEMAGLSRIGITSDGAPPPFVAFGKAVDNYKKVKENTRTLDFKQSENGDDEFDEQRKAAIAEVTKITGASKTFQAANKTNFENSKPDSVSNKHTTFANQRHNLDERKANRHEAAQKESARPHGMYRELSTDSGENVHQKTVNEFVEMGFKHTDVVLCLRKSNNNFDQAMDMLVSMSKDSAGPTENKSRYDGRRGGSRMTGRGRGRGRPNHGQEDDHISQSANSATLFDFLESKISSGAILNDETEKIIENYAKNRTPDAGERRDQYEYRRDSGHTGNQAKANFSKSKPVPQKYENSRYQKGSGNEKVTETNRNNRGRRDGGVSSRMTKESYNNRQTNDYESGQRYFSNRISGETKGTSDVRIFHDIPEFGTSADEYRKENRNKHRHQNGRDERSIPPRFQKKISNADWHQRTMQNREATRRVNVTGSKNPGSNDKDEGTRGENRESFSHTSLSVENTNEVSFSNVTLNPPPKQIGPTTFGDTHCQLNEAQSPETRVHVTLPEWQIGSQCMAKYWEDGHFYEAIITDLHDTAPTAVVQFVGFGNYEEVVLFDLKPLVLHMTDNPDARRGSMQNRSSSSRNNRTHVNARNACKPPMPLYRPPPSRNVT